MRKYFAAAPAALVLTITLSVSNPAWPEEPTGVAVPASLGSFSRPDLLAAFRDGDNEVLERDALATFFYASSVTSTLDSEALYRMGGEPVLDPTVAAALNTRLMTSPELLDAILDLGSGMGETALKNFAAERGSNVADGDIDPAGEIAAIFSGLAGGTGNRVAAMLAGQRDARQLMALGTRDPAAFEEIYLGIRAWALGS